MYKTFKLTKMVTLAATVSSPALAQAFEPGSQAPRAQTIELSTIKVGAEEDSPVSHRFGEALDSGTSSFDKSSIDLRTPGSGDVNAVLRALPTVQFSSQSGRATQANLQDLRPSEISISGGLPNENLFLVDGIGVNSRLDVSSTNPMHYIEGNAAASAQSLWIDSSLVGDITVRDSNVSAEFGQFTGGVVEINTRAPGTDFAIDAHYGETGPDLAQFRISRRARDILGEDLPAQPDYLKRRYGVSVDLPVAENFGLLLGYNFSKSRVEYERGANYSQYGDYSQQSVSRNFLAKAELRLPDETRVTGQLSYSPYESEFSHPNGIDNWTYLDGGGLSGNIRVEGRANDADWSLEVSHAVADNDRRVDRPGTINVHASAPGVDWCAGSSCSLGAPNPINQRQHDTAIRGRWSQPLAGGEVRLGAEFGHVQAVKTREESSYAFRHISSSGSDSTLWYEISPNTVCAQPQRFADTCVDGAYALAQMNPEMAFTSKARVNIYTLWSEWQGDLAGVDVRAGLRYDHESFLGNHNIAPRLSVSRDLPFAGMNLTLGANRYYGRSFLGYALRENYPDNYIYRRAPLVVGGKNIWSDNWTLYSHSILPRYANAGLKTPYADEFTAALRGPVPLIGGEYRVRGILRDSKNKFARSEEITTREELETGRLVTVRNYTITNDGESSYRGLSLEYVRSFGDHSLAISTNLSKTKSSNVDLFEMADGTEFEGEDVYYQGEVVPLLRAIASNQLEDFAAPFVLNFDWAAHWFGSRLRTNIKGRYRSGFERVDDTGANIRINGLTYDVYDIVKFKDAVSFDLSASLDVIKSRLGAVTMDLRVNNVFNTVLERDYTNSSQPWQLGRSAWLSIKYAY